MTTSATTEKTPERVWFLGSLATIHLSAEEAGTPFSLVEMRCPAGEQPPLHVHESDDEGFYVLEGEVELWVGSEHHRLSAGEFLLAPHGVPHTYLVSDPGARMLVTSSDGSFDRFVASYGEPATEDRLPDPGPPDLARLERLADEHGITLLGPPGALPG
jgi:quercetin dioxygenase-like cupin family protein